MAGESLELVDRGAGTSIDTGSVQQRDAQSSSPEPQVSGPEFSLPPVDRGKQAWMFLAACWAVEALVFGFGLSFGVFQDYYSHHEPFKSSGNIAVIGTTTLGTIYIATPFVIALCRLFPRWARWFTLAGLSLASLSMIMSSFCTSVSQLIATQGFLFGLGGCFAYCPCVLYIDEWFAQRKGMAYGIVWDAAGFGGVVLPLLLETLLNKVGFPSATRIWGGILFVASTPLAYFVKPRLPYSATTNKRLFNMRYVKSRLFVLHQLANVIQATGYFLPGIYLPIYARTAFGASGFLSALTVILVNLSATLGSAIMGTMTDKFHVTTCIILSASGGATSVFLLWGLSPSLPVLFVFCFLYGLFAGSWTSMWPGIMKEVSQRGESDGYGYVDPVMVYGQLSMGRGVGNIISGPLSDTLIKGMPWQGQALAGYGSGYGILIVYTGITGLVSGMNFLLKHLNLL